jgi:hypothetical protein
VLIPIPPRADSLLRRDSTAQRADSAKPPRDTVQPPLARAFVPRIPSADSAWRWSGRAILATGALTLSDLLDRIPGVHVYRTGWLPNPASATYAGDFSRVRVYLDGIELSELDPRARGVLDLSRIQLANAEDVVVERGATEVRVHLRSWRVERTTPFTRTDVATGDQGTNLYRGFFGKRWGGGQVLQLIAQQYGVTPPERFGASSDQLGIFARAGWASRRGVTVDGVIHRTSGNRGTIRTFEAPVDDSIASLRFARSDMYARVAFGDPDTSRRWIQLLAAGSSHGSKNVQDFQRTETDTIDRDTTRFQAQYAITGGGRFGPVTLSATERILVRDGKTYRAPTATASYAAGIITGNLRWEDRGSDSTTRTDAVIEVLPLPFLRLVAAAGLSTRDTQDGDVDATTLRAEAGVRFRDLWITGGLLRRDTAYLIPPVAFDSSFRPVAEGPADAMTLSIRGRLWKSTYVDLSGIRWSDTTGYYRPRYQARSEFGIRTTLPRRFPSGNFGLVASVAHDYRSGVSFPTATGPVSVRGYRTVSSLLEIRILSAIVSWQFRNFLGESYKQVPDYLLNRQTNFYGVRWEFWN